MEAIEFKARAESVKCPHCGKWNDGLLGDPRGREADCDSCGQHFHISHEANMIVD